MGTSPAHYQFGPFHLDAAEHRLLRDGVEVPLQLKVFETLCVLVENAGRLLKKEDLLSQVWPDSVVEENNLNKNVSILRKALGERATGQSYIETVPRVGYRFVAPVKNIASEAVLPAEAAGLPAHLVPRQDIRFSLTPDGRAPCLGEHWTRTAAGEGLKLAYTPGFRVGQPYLAALVDRTEQTPSRDPL